MPRRVSDRSVPHEICARERRCVGCGSWFLLPYQRRYTRIVHCPDCLHEREAGREHVMDTVEYIESGKGLTDVA